MVAATPPTRWRSLAWTTLRRAASQGRAVVDLLRQGPRLGRLSPSSPGRPPRCPPLPATPPHAPSRAHRHRPPPPPRRRPAGARRGGHGAGARRPAGPRPRPRPARGRARRPVTPVSRADEAPVGVDTPAPLGEPRRRRAAPEASMVGLLNVLLRHRWLVALPALIAFVA